MEFAVGDIVVANNGVKVKGKPLSEIPAIVERVSTEHLSLIYDNFKYNADIKDCKKVNVN